MAALVGANGNTLGIFLQCRLNHLGHRAVVSQVNHLNTGALQYAAHNINCRIVAIEETSSGNKTQGNAFFLCRI